MRPGETQPRKGETARSRSATLAQLFGAGAPPIWKRIEPSLLFLLRTGLALAGLWFGFRLGRCALLRTSFCRLRFFAFFSGAGFLFGCVLVIFAPIISDVESAAFEDQSGPSANHLFHLALAPRFQGTKLLGADRQRFGRHRLGNLKFVLTFRAQVLVRRHTLILIWFGGIDSGRSVNAQCRSAV